MQSKELLKMSLRASDFVMPLLLDMKDAPLTFPTSNGGNHPLWILGHLTHGEGWMFWECMRGKSNPVPEEWGGLFAGGTTPQADAGAYPSFDELLSTFEDLRGQTTALLDSLSEDDLDQQSVNCPDGWENAFGTWRQCFLMAGMHWMGHRGQLADARRAAGREPLMA